MLQFNFQHFLEREGIKYTIKGVNVKRGNINIKCPFCSDDPSDHMGISLTTGYWSCWRNDFHRGKRPERLIRAITGCTWDEAAQIAGSDKIVEDATFDDLKQRLADTEDKEEQIEELEFEDAFRKIKNDGYGMKFISYLHKRGFTSDTRKLIKQYGLMRCMSGRFKYRLIFPFHMDGKLIGWTGRTISKKDKLRYLSYPNDTTIKRFLYNYDQANKTGGQRLVVVEGPFDCLKVDFYGQHYGVRAVGLLGVSTTEAQLALISRLSRRFDEVAFLMDSNALAQSMSIQSKMMVLRPLVLSLPRGVDDPGDLTKDQVLVTTGTPW